ncbi:MAG: acyl carrier protein, partial [Pseudonocardiaceae bacterium]
MTSHFFDELGAHSLLMTRFSALARKHADLPPIGIRDIYQHSNIRELAAALEAATATPPPDHHLAAPAGKPAGKLAYG